jgi:uncharacterized protein (TIGR00299 family) protein
VKTAHGLLPVPAPAVAELVRGLPVYGGSPADGELLTPTAAAVLCTLGASFGPLPPMRVSAIGLGAGERDRETPNVLRFWVGEADAEVSDTVHLLVANIDDMNPELYGYLLERLLAAGALDAYLTPIIMKKSRPGVVLAALTVPERSADLEEIIFAESTSLGIRRSVMTRNKLERSQTVVQTIFGPIRIKIGKRSGRVVTVAPEFEDCQAAAKAHNAALKTVYQAAQQAFHESSGA